MGDRGMAEPAVIHVQPKIPRGIRARLVLGQHRDLVAKLVDDALIDVDRLGPLAIPRQVGRIHQQLVGLGARIRLKFLGRPILGLSPACSPQQCQQSREPKRDGPP